MIPNSAYHDGPALEAEINAFMTYTYYNLTRKLANCVTRNMLEINVDASISISYEPDDWYSFDCSYYEGRARIHVQGKLGETPLVQVYRMMPMPETHNINMVGE